jgi:hypothetical protein
MEIVRVRPGSSLEREPYNDSKNLSCFTGGATECPSWSPMGWWSSRRISEHII